MILEIMLQRTPAERVNKLFDKFLKKYPNPHVLSSSSDKDLERSIQTLGLQKRRTMLLKNLAEHLIEKFGGYLPSTEEELLQLPGVGRYVANAVLCYSHGKTVPLIDTNAARVLGRVFGFVVTRDPSKDERLWVFAQDILPSKSAREFNWALIDFGALICRPKTPLCDNCPMSDLCLFALSKKTEGLG
jgi:A/G-specific adenine glycosylase